MNKLVYVRHGESNTTVARVIGGHRTCSGLSPLGVQQAERLRDRWAANPEFTPDHIIASHFSRARQTAEIVAEAFADLPQFSGKVEIDEEFGEHDPGPDCDGMTMDDFVDRFGTGAWESDPFGVSFPGGETIAGFQFRIGSAVRRIADAHEGQTVLIVCHGGVIDAVVRQALKAPPTGSFMINTLNTSITELTLLRPNFWSLRRYGDAAHLAGLPAATVA
ncbi:MAG: histidine phosphatase family protein [Actinobacteria bacterium]|nr:histidine phosphatase family protein [Actinomycetota bacterium]